MELDGSDNVYVTGFTESTDFPNAGVPLSALNSGGRDIFVTKVAPDGASLVYSTYIGGANNDRALDIVLDSSNQAVIVGDTFSSDLPVPGGAYQAAHSDLSGATSDAFILTLNSSGSAISAGTYLGGSSDEVTNDINVARGEADDIFVCGDTNSSNFPLAGGLGIPFSGGTDIFLTKFTSVLTAAPVYSTFVSDGGCNDIEIDIRRGTSNEEALIVGYTQNIGGNFPTTTDSYDETHNGGFDAFLLNINDDGDDVDYATFFGGSDDDFANAISDISTVSCVICPVLDVTIGGNTLSSDLPIVNSSSTFSGGAVLGDGFTARIRQQTSNPKLLLSQYFGGSDDDSITVLERGVTAGITKSSEAEGFPVGSNAINSIDPGSTYKGFISTIYTTEYVGVVGTNEDIVTDVRVNQTTLDTFVVGYTENSGFPATGFDTSFGGGVTDAFVYQLSPTLTSTLIATPGPAQVNLSWSDVDYILSGSSGPPEQYIIEYGPSFFFPGPEGRESITVNSDITSIIIPGLDPTFEYGIHVYPVYDDEGSPQPGPLSNQVNLTVLADINPDIEIHLDDPWTEDNSATTGVSDGVAGGGNDFTPFGPSTDYGTDYFAEFDTGFSAIRYEFDDASIAATEARGSSTIDTLTGGATTIPFSDPDDSLSSPIAIPFDFFLYDGNQQTSFVVSPNGFLLFGGPNDTVDTISSGNTDGQVLDGQTLTNGTDDYLVAGFWNDMSLTDVVGPSFDPPGIVEYEILGTAPNRRLVVNFSGLYDAQGPDANASFQIKLYETPAIPSTDLTLMATGGDEQVDLSWSADSNAVDYDVEYSTNGTTFTTFVDGENTNTSTTVTGLTNATLYYFRVRATNSSGDGPWSNTAIAIPSDAACDTGLYTTGVNPVFFEEFCSTTYKNPSSTARWQNGGDHLSLPTALRSVADTTVFDATNDCAFMTLGDIDGNGLEDLVCTGFTPGFDYAVFVYENDGDANPFDGPPTILTNGDTFGMDFVFGHKLIDLDDDGHLDHVFTSNADGFWVGINSGTGPVSSRFSSYTNYDPGSGSYDARGSAIGDFNDDGYPDIAIADQGNANDELYIHYNDESGDFPDPPTLINAGNRAIEVIAADLDGSGDGYLDLVLANRGTGAGANGSFQVLLNASGTFAAPVTYNSGVVNRQAEAVDLDEDGDLDLVIANHYDSEVYVFTNNGVGGFTIVSDPCGEGTPECDNSFSPNIDSVGYSLQVGDYNRDGFFDIITGEYDEANIFLGNGPLSFDSGVTVDSMDIELVSSNAAQTSLPMFFSTDACCSNPEMHRIFDFVPVANTALSLDIAGGNSFSEINITTNTEFNSSFDLEVSNNGTTFDTVGTGITSDLSGANVATTGSSLYFRMTLNGAVDDSTFTDSMLIEMVSGSSPSSGDSGGSIQRFVDTNPPDGLSVEVLSTSTARLTWNDSSANELGYTILNEKNEAILTASTNQVEIIESGLNANTGYQRRVFASYQAGQSSLVDFPRFVTFIEQPLPKEIARTAADITIGLVDSLTNLAVGDSAVQVELVTESSQVSAEQFFLSGWVQEDSYTFTGIDTTKSMKVRIRARNQTGLETAWSDYVTLSSTIPGEPTMNASLVVHPIEGIRTTFDPLFPKFHSVTIGVSNVSDVVAENVFVQMAVPSPLAIVPSTLFVNDDLQTGAVDADFGQSSNGYLSVIIPKLSSHKSVAIRFQLEFEEEDAKQFSSDDEVRNNVTSQIQASVSSLVLPLQATVSVSNGSQVFSSNLITLFATEAAEQPQVVVPPIITPAIPGTQPGLPGGNRTTPPTKSLPIQEDGAEPKTGLDNLILTLKSQAIGRQVEFTGATSKPNSEVTVVFENGLTKILMSDDNGVWKTFVDASDLGIEKGESRTIHLQATAKNQQQKSNTVYQTVLISLAADGEVLLEIEKNVSDIGGSKILQDHETLIQSAMIVLLPVIISTSLPLWGYLPYFPHLIIHFISWLVSLLKRSEDNQNFGIVYDSITKQPLPLAIIRVYKQQDKQRKLMRTIVSDKLGRYYILLEPGQYYLETKKPSYSFPSLIVPGEEDGQYRNLYSEKRGFFVDEKSVALPNLALDPVDRDYHFEMGNIFKKFWMALQSVGIYTALPLLFIGSIFGVINLLSNPTSLINWLISITYLVMFIWQLVLRPHPEKPWGVVYEVLTKAPIPLATIQLVDASFGKVVASRLTDYRGRYSFLPDPGNYVVNVKKEGYQQANLDKQSTNSSRETDLEGAEVTISSSRGKLISKDIPLVQKSSK